MTSVFLDANGILMIDYLQKKQTINGTYYASLLRQLRENIYIYIYIGQEPWQTQKRCFVSPGQCSSPHICLCYGCHQWLWLWTDSTSLLFAWSHSIRLPFIPKFVNRSCLVPILTQMMTPYMQWRTVWTVKKSTKAHQHHWQKCIDTEGDYVEK